MTRIFLIGYMGSGKTTVGKLLAARLGFTFVDMDAHIEEKEFLTVARIFEEEGEARFRDIEQKCLHEVGRFENAVISTGGGAPCFFDNMDFMNANGITVYLRLTPGELAGRLESLHANKRPLLANRKGEELQQFIAQGLAAREPYYSRAMFSVHGDVESVVDQICGLVS